MNFGLEKILGQKIGMVQESESEGVRLPNQQELDTILNNLFGDLKSHAPDFITFLKDKNIKSLEYPSTYPSLDVFTSDIFTLVKPMSDSSGGLGLAYVLADERIGKIEDRGGESKSGWYVPEYYMNAKITQEIVNNSVSTVIKYDWPKLIADRKKELINTIIKMRDNIIQENPRLRTNGGWDFRVASSQWLKLHTLVQSGVIYALLDTIESTRDYQAYVEGNTMRRKYAQKPRFVRILNTPMSEIDNVREILSAGSLKNILKKDNDDLMSVFNSHWSRAMYAAHVQNQNMQVLIKS